VGSLPGLQSRSAGRGWYRKTGWGHRGAGWCFAEGGCGPFEVAADGRRTGIVERNTAARRVFGMLAYNIDSPTTGPGAMLIRTRAIIRAPETEMG